MKTLLVFFFTMGLSPLFIVNPTPQTVTITIEIFGLRSTDGVIGIALHDGISPFPGGEPAFSKEVSIEDRSSVIVVFEDVPAGEYAAAVMHDENGNGEMDVNNYGMPTEGFGFSNEADASMGPPSFADASFLAEKDVEESIEVIYLGGY